MKLLLHACCGPCSLEPTRLLKAAGHDITIYYANSNIHPAEEYQHRLATLRAWASAEGFDVLEGPYNPASWENVCGRIGDAAIADVERARAEAAANSRLQSVTDTQAEGAGENERADSESASDAVSGRSQANAHTAAAASALDTLCSPLIRRSPSATSSTSSPLKSTRSILPSRNAAFSDPQASFMEWSIPAAHPTGM